MTNLKLEKALLQVLRPIWRYVASSNSIRVRPNRFKHVFRVTGGTLIVFCASIWPGLPAVSDEESLRRGVEQFRFCAACHALRPGVHTTGPSLAGLFDRPAGTAEGFTRYSNDLKMADFEWSAETLDAWLADPVRMFPGTYMDIPGMRNAESRSDLIAFLEVATTPEGLARAVSSGLIAEGWTWSVTPEPIRGAPPSARVAAIRHCGDSYIIATEDGTERPVWEKNVRLKIDSTETGPPERIPVVIESGRMGDRMYVIFHSLRDLKELLSESC